MAKAPQGFDIVIVKPTNYDEIITKSQGSPDPYTAEKLEQMYRQGLASNCAVFVAFITPALWED